MNSSFLNTFLETGIPFEEFPQDQLDFRYKSIFRDSNFNRGDGYEIQIIITETRGEITIGFDSFANNLIEESKKKLSENWMSLLGMKNSGHLTIKAGNKFIPIRESGIDQVVGFKDFKLKFETKMYDLRKFYEWDSLNQEIEHIVPFLVFSLFPYETKITGEIEGKMVDILSTKYERSRKNRALCIGHHGYNCKACNMSFLDSYGNLAKNYIHVHHINPISEAGISIVDPIKDLIPLCPNCHAVVHLKTPPYSLDELKVLLKKVSRESV